MNLHIRRYEKSDDGRATIGRWYDEDEYLCFNLEDTFRETGLRPASHLELPLWVKQWKVAGHTAIPSGTYQVIIDRSPLFSQRASSRAGFHLDIFTPHVLGVPGYSGIRIHSGTNPEDTEGCQCPGLTHVPGSSVVGDSRKAMELLMPRIEAALGMERIEAPDSRISAFLRHWAFNYRQVGKPEEVWLTVSNDFSPINGPQPVEGVDT